MRAFILSFLCCIFLIPAPLLAEDAVTLASLEKAGVQPLSKDEVTAIFSKARLTAQSWEHTYILLPQQGCALTGTAAHKFLPVLKRPVQGKGEWSVADDGTLRISMVWTTYEPTLETGKVYPLERFYYVIGPQSGTERQAFRIAK